MPSTSPPPSRRERAALSDLFDDVGPDAPTLCGDWTTRDLAAHIVMRERRPDGAVGVIVPPLSGYADKVQASIADADWDDLVDRVRDGPPVWSPTRLSAIDKAVNTIEFFVHHEDVRRTDDDWDERVLDQDLRDDLRTALGRMARLLARGLKVGLILEPTDTSDTTPLVVKKGDPEATISGPIGEIVLFMYGRKSQSDVEVSGAATAVEIVLDSDFGI